MLIVVYSESSCSCCFTLSWMITIHSLVGIDCCVLQILLSLVFILDDNNTHLLSLVDVDCILSSLVSVLDDNNTLSHQC